MKDSVFSKIISGEIPCEKVFEDEHTFAFMDIFPVQEGMVVVATKQQIADVEDLPPEVASSLMFTVQKIMKALRRMYPEKKKVGVQIAGLNTPDHAHATVFPIDTGEEFRAESPSQQANHAKLATQAERLKELLEK